MTDREFTEPSARPSVRRALEIGRYKEIGGPGLAAAVLIGAAEVADALSAWSDWHRYGVVRDYLAGLPGITEDDLNGADRLAAATGWGYLIALLVAAVVFLVWLWRARTNAEVLCDASHRRSRGWVIGGWICPVVNLWFPFQIVDDVHRASRPDNPRDLIGLRDLPGSTLVGFWWALWLGGLLINRYAGTILGGEITLESFHGYAILTTISASLDVAAAVLIIKIMRQVSAWQSPRWATGNAG
jgi:Domain of unknown function (DUF4328)